MKNVILTALLLASASAFAKGPKSKAMSFEDFKKVAKEAAQGIGDFDSGCTFSVEPNGRELRLIMVDEDNKRVEVIVPETAKITHIDHAAKGSGDGVDDYRIKGHGVLGVINADDAFFRVDLDNGKDKASCEIDF